MLQRFSDNLDGVEIHAQGKEIAAMMWKDRDDNGDKVYDYPDTQTELVTTLPNPVLVTDSYKAHQITDYIKRETTLALMNKSRKITEYDNLVLDFDQNKYPTLRWPNIDTLVFCRALKQEFENNNDLRFKMYNTALEVGCWSGFIGQYIWQKMAENSEESRDTPIITFVDINQEAEKFYNDTREKTSFPFQSEIYIQDARELLDLGKKWDLLACNPPYIPRPNSIENNAYEWLELLRFLIENFDWFVEKNGAFITNISNLSKKIIDPILAQSWLKVEVIDTIQVPLKVFNVLNNKERLDHLKTQHGLIEQVRDWHQYWHELSVLKITKPQ